MLSPKISILQTVGLGYAHYKSNRLKNDDEYIIDSNLLGINAELSLHYTLSPETSIGFLTSLFTSIYAPKPPIETTTNEKWNKLDLSRFDFSLNYRVNF